MSSETVKVHAPAAGFTGSVAGVNFAGGVADVEEGTAAMAYFRRHGYGIGEPANPPVRIQTVDSRTVGVVQQGAVARDAAVDPHPTDYLPPVNAGKADPHSQAVVAPQLHGQPPPQAIVTAVEQAEADGAEVPNKSASKADWVTYATSPDGGMSTEDAEAATRDDLADKFLGSDS